MIVLGKVSAHHALASRPSVNVLGSKHVASVGLEANRDLDTLLYHDGLHVPQHLDLATMRTTEAIFFFNQSLERGRTRLHGPDAALGGLTSPATWFDFDSVLAVDWRRSIIFWCQRSSRRIMTARLREDYPVLVLVNHTLCSGLVRISGFQTRFGPDASVEI